MSNVEERGAVSRAMVAFARRHPWVMLLSAIALLVGSAAGVTRLKSDFTHRGYLYPGDKLLTDLDDLEARFGNDDTVVVAVKSPSGIFDADSVALVRSLTEQLWLAPEVNRVDSIVNFQWVHAQGDELVVESLLPEGVEKSTAELAKRKQVALSHESLPGYLISKDGTTALVFARMRPSFDKHPDAKLITGAINDLVHKLQRTDHEIHVTGGPPIEAAYAAAAEHDNATLFPVVLLACIVILTLTLRNAAAVAIAFLVMFASVIGTVGAAGWLGVTITSVTASIPAMMMAIGLTDPVHNLVTFLGERKKGIDPKLAAEYALAKNLLPSFVCFVTTAVGFGSFLTANIKTISELGLAAAVGCSLAWLFSQLFLGGLLFIIKWKRLPPSAAEHNTRLANFLTSWVDRRRPYVIGVFVVLSLGGAFAGAMNRVDADPVKYFAKGHPLRDATDFIEAGVGASRSLELVVDAGKVDGAKSAAFLSRVDKLESWLRQQSKITQTLSIVDVLKHTHRALSGGVQTAFALAEDDGTVAQELMLYSMNLPEGLGLNDRLTLEQDALRISVLWTVGSSHEAVAKIRDIENKAQELGLNLTVTGKYPLFQRMEDHLVKSFLSSFFSSIIVVIAIMMAFFRSVRVGLFAMVPNVVPLMVGGLVLWLLDERFTIGTMLVSSVCLGIAVDDTSYYLSEYLHLTKLGRTPREAVHEVYEGTGPSIFATTAVLVITFGAFALSTFTPNQVFGIMTAVVLGVAWCTDIVLLPALLLLQRGKKQPEPTQDALQPEAEPSLAE